MRHSPFCVYRLSCNQPDRTGGSHWIPPPIVALRCPSSLWLYTTNMDESINVVHICIFSKASFKAFLSTKVSFADGRFRDKGREFWVWFGWSGSFFCLSVSKKTYTCHTVSGHCTFLVFCHTDYPIQAKMRKSCVFPVGSGDKKFIKAAKKHIE